MSSPSKAPEPIAGEIIASSFRKTIWLLASSILMLCFGLFLIWDWGTGARLLVRGPAHVGQALGVAVLGVAGGLFGLVSISRNLVRLTRMRPRLVFGDDRLQAVVKVNHNDTVVLQIPYRNIAGSIHERKRRIIRIDLLALEDPDTYCAETIDGRVCIIGDYQVGLAQIHEKILAHRGARPGT